LPELLCQSLKLMSQSNADDTRHFSDTGQVVANVMSYPTQVEVHIVTDRLERLSEVINSTWDNPTAVHIHEGVLDPGDDRKKLTWKHRPIMERSYREGV
jgi:hypothetical protein